MLTVQEIPLSKLVPSTANVRKSGRSEGIKELAASIKAHGLLQNLTVRKGTGASKGKFEVVAGGRRLAALQRLAEKDEIKASASVPCHVLADENAAEISLAENVMHCPMHPADQYEAFAKLHREQNMPAEDIAARFGVSPAVVRQRLKLGSVSPRLIKRYRNGEMTLDQLTAFTITDDTKEQERVWKSLPEFRRSRSAILEALTASQIPADDRRALFVGAEAYEKAGGIIVRDLFEADGAYFADAALLERLVREKLQRAAAKVMAEGWKWVSVELHFDYAAASDMRRVYPRLSAADQARLEALLCLRTDLYEAQGEERETEHDLDTVEAEIAALQERREYHPEDIARAGAFVCLGADGDERIERGYVRAEDYVSEPAPADDTSADGHDDAPAPRLLSDKLVIELSAARTSAMRNELAEHPATALTALLHALVLWLFYGSADGSALELSGQHRRCIVMARPWPRVLPRANSRSGTRHGRKTCRRTVIACGTFWRGWRRPSAWASLLIASPSPSTPCTVPMSRPLPPISWPAPSRST